MKDDVGDGGAGGEQWCSQGVADFPAKALMLVRDSNSFFERFYYKNLSQEQLSYDNNFKPSFQEKKHLECTKMLQISSNLWVFTTKNHPQIQPQEFTKKTPISSCWVIEVHRLELKFLNALQLLKKLKGCDQKTSGKNTCCWHITFHGTPKN